MSKASNTCPISKHARFYKESDYKVKVALMWIVTKDENFQKFKYRIAYALPKGLIILTFTKEMR